MHKPASAILGLSLAACSQQSGTTTVTANADTGAVTTTTTGNPPTAASMGIQPGKWQTIVTITDIKMSGLPAGMKLPARVSEPTTVTSCVTPEQAAKGPGDFLKASGGKCTATSSSYAGGKIDVAMSCTLPSGTLTTHSTGTYSPTAMTSDAEASMTGHVAMSEKVHTEAKRIGDCAG